MFPCLPASATFVADTKNVSDFVQKHFVSATNVSQFVQPEKHHGQQCVRNNVSLFTRAFTVVVVVSLKLPINNKNTSPTLLSLRHSSQCSVSEWVF